MSNIDDTTATDDTTPRQRALAALLDCDPSDIDQLRYDGPFGYGEAFDAPEGEWAVLTEDEAEDAWECALDSYLEGCIYPTLEGNLASYFDDEKWKRDARFDGRGHSLSSYDGCEEDATDPETGDVFVIYRTN